MAIPVRRFDELFAAMSAAHAAAVDRLGEDRIRLDVAGRMIDIRFAGRDCARALRPALAHLVVPRSDAPPDLTIAAWDSASADLAPPRPDWSSIAIGRKGYIPELSRQGGHTAFAYGAGVVQTYDATRAQAVYWTDDADKLPYWERSFPLRQTFAWFLAPTDLMLAHAACVARDGRAILLPGASGSGKTTTALRLALEGFDLLGDDYVLVEGRAPCRVWSLYRSAKLDRRSVELLPELAAFAHESRAGDEKAAVLWPTPAGGGMARCAELGVIALPRVSREGANRLAPATGADVVFALAPTTINHLDGEPAKVMRVARSLAGAAPAYHLHLGPDPGGLSSRMRELLGEACRPELPAGLPAGQPAGQPA